MDLVLRRENQSCVLAAAEDGSALTTRALLEKIVESECGLSVIIDVGAQILDLSNRDVASQWLDMKMNASHALCYDETDNAQILDRQGVSSPLAVSPLRDRLDKILIFLDQARCRGTNLLIPPGAKAAVILGSRLNRDRLLQSCMRMRKLGTSHSLVFVAPPHVHRNILDSPNTSYHVVTSADVLTWSINQTLAQLKKNTTH